MKPILRTLLVLLLGASLGAGCKGQTDTATADKKGAAPKAGKPEDEKPPKGKKVGFQ